MGIEIHTQGSQGSSNRVELGVIDGGDRYTITVNEYPLVTVRPSNVTGKVKLERHILPENLEVVVKTDDAYRIHPS